MLMFKLEISRLDLTGNDLFEKGNEAVKKLLFEWDILSRNCFLSRASNYWFLSIFLQVNLRDRRGNSRLKMSPDLPPPGRQSGMWPLCRGTPLHPLQLGILDRTTRSAAFRKSCRRRTFQAVSQCILLYRHFRKKSHNVPQQPVEEEHQSLQPGSYPGLECLLKKISYLFFKFPARWTLFLP